MKTSTTPIADVNVISVAHVRIRCSCNGDEQRLLEPLALVLGLLGVSVGICQVTSPSSGRLASPATAAVLSSKLESRLEKCSATRQTAQKRSEIETRARQTKANGRHRL